MLGLVVVDGGLDGVFGQNRAMNLHRRQGELFGNFRIGNLGSFLKRLALDPFGHERARSDRRAAAVGLELRVLNDTFVVDLDLKTHHVAAGGSTHHTGADRFVVLVERADVSRIFVVIHQFFAVGHFPVLNANFSKFETNQ